MAKINTIVHEFGSGASALCDGSDPVVSHMLSFDSIVATLSTQATEASGCPLVLPTLSVTLLSKDFTAADTSSIQDFLLGTAGTPYESRVSVDPALSELFLFDWNFDVEGAAATFRKCRCTGLRYGNGSVTIEATVYGTATWG
jgi:hypothetical protein